MTQRKMETTSERSERLIREIQAKKDGAAAEEAAIDRMIKRSIADYGP